MNCKYYKQKKQVSYDNGVTWYDLSEYRTGSLYESGGTDCNQYTPIYRWVNTTGYMCNGTSKYARMKKQVSNDNGVTYIDVVPAEYMNGSLIEYNSEDCGYSPDPPSPYASQYLTIESLENNNIIEWVYSDIAWGSRLTISASTDNGNTWTVYEASSNYNPNVGIIATLNAGDKILIKAKHSSYVYEYHFTSLNANQDDYLENPHPSVKVYGNIMSLISGDSFSYATELTNENFLSVFHGLAIIDASNLILPRNTSPRCYYGLFRGCTKLTTPPQLPATTLTEYCYEAMFDACTSLTTAPALPATTLAVGCYENMFAVCESLITPPVLPATTLANACYLMMFEGCTSLTTAPALPATTLAPYCYSNMFFSCTSLTTAPQLPATTLADACYYQMFGRCTSLNYIKCLATYVEPENHTSGWVDGVAASGTFVKSSDVSVSTWTRGNNGIPSGWTVQNA